jgi:integrase
MSAKETAIVVATPLDLERVDVERLSKRPRSKATVRAYDGDWARWEEFCSTRGLSTLAAAEKVEDAIVWHLSDLRKAGLRPATIARAYATIRARHLDMGHPLPTLEKVRNALTNIGRELGTAPHAKTPLVADALKRVARAYDEDASDEVLFAVERALAVRDAALLLVGFGAARRPSEAVALDVGDVVFVEDGLRVTVRRSKTDQRGEGHTVGVMLGSSRATCPARSLRRWLDLAGITSGPIFRGVDRGGHVLQDRLSTEGVARAVKRAAKRVGLDPTGFGGHSLRSGFATSAAEAGKSMASIMRQGGWQSDRTVRERYIRPGTLFKDNASEGLL